MHKEQVVGIAVRLFAIFLGLYTLWQVSSLLPLISSQPSNNFSLTFILLMAAPLIIAAILLWRFPLVVAARIIPDVRTKKPVTPLDAGSIGAVAFSVMGLWVLATAVPDIVYWITFIYRTKSADIGNPTLSPANIAGLVSTIVELVIGFWLLFGSRGILGLIKLARYAGA